MFSYSVVAYLFKGVELVAVRLEFDSELPNDELLADMSLAEANKYGVDYLQELGDIPMEQRLTLVHNGSRYLTQSELDSGQEVCEFDASYGLEYLVHCSDTGDYSLGIPFSIIKECDECPFGVDKSLLGCCGANSSTPSEGICQFTDADDSVGEVVRREIKSLANAELYWLTKMENEELEDEKRKARQEKASLTRFRNRNINAKIAKLKKVLESYESVRTMTLSRSVVEALFNHTDTSSSEYLEKQALALNPIDCQISEVKSSIEELVEKRKKGNRSSR